MITSCYNLFSTLNPNMEIMIKPLCDERDWRREDIIELAEKLMKTGSKMNVMM